MRGDSAQGCEVTPSPGTVLWFNPWECPLVKGRSSSPSLVQELSEFTHSDRGAWRGTRFGAFEPEEGQRSRHSWGGVKIICKLRVSSLVPRVCLLSLGNSEASPKAAPKRWDQGVAALCLSRADSEFSLVLSCFSSSAEPFLLGQ